MTLLFLLSCGVHRAEIAVASRPEDAGAWKRLGNAYWRSRRVEEARNAYRVALDLDSDQDIPRGRLHTGSDLLALRTAVVDNPQDDEMWGDMGDNLLASGDTQGAIEAYERARRLDPADTEWTNALVQLGQIDLESIDTTYMDDETLGDFADAIRNNGDEERACELYRQAAELDPLDDEWVGHARRCGFPIPEGYGAVPLEEGFGPDSGLAMPIEALPSDPVSLQHRVDGDVALLVRLGQAYALAGEKDRAIDTLWGAVLVEPTDTEALQSYLLVSERTLLDVLEDLAARLDDDDEVLGALGDHYLELGRHDDARERYRAASEADPDDPEWKAKLDLLD